MIEKKVNRSDLLKKLADTQKSINFLKQSPGLTLEQLSSVSSDLEKIESALKKYVLQGTK